MAQFLRGRPKLLDWGSFQRQSLLYPLSIPIEFIIIIIICLWLEFIMQLSNY
jgi:hypothetical protein